MHLSEDVPGIVPPQRRVVSVAVRQLQLRRMLVSALTAILKANATRTALTAVRKLQLRRILVSAGHRVVAHLLHS